MVSTDDRYISVREAARRLQVHENTIRNWVSEGRLCDARVPGSRYLRLSRAEVDLLVSGRRLADQVNTTYSLLTDPERESLVLPLITFFARSRKERTEPEALLRDNPAALPVSLAWDAAEVVVPAIERIKAQAYALGYTAGQDSTKTKDDR